METHSYCVSQFGKEGVYTAFTNDPDDVTCITYGAKVYKKGLFYKAANMLPTGIPQECTMPNANILLVSKTVCENIGILSEDYIHGGADWDYGFLCKKAGFPVLTTSHVCGACKNDHKDASEEAKIVKSMTIKERKAFVNRPTREYKDGFTFLKKYNKSYEDLLIAKNEGEEEAAELLEDFDVALLSNSPSKYNSRSVDVYTVERTETNTCKIEKIELKEDRTIVHLAMQGNEGGDRYMIQPTTILYDEDTETSYYLLATENCAIYPQWSTKSKSERVRRFRLIFEKVPSSVKKLTFYEGKNSDWNFYGIDMR
jgi:hypothetical protein